MICYDLIFGFFIASQEVNDLSYLKGLTMQAKYTKYTLLLAALISKPILNFITVLISFLYSGFLLTEEDGKIISFIIIYFVCSYEFLFHVMDKFATYLAL